MQTMLDILLKTADWVSHVASVLARLMLLLVAAMLFVQVVLRYVFLYSLPWPEEASRYLMIWTVMITGSVLVKDEQLVAVDFFDTLWPKRVIAYRNALFRLMLVGLLCVLFMEGLDQALGSALMIFHMVVLILRDVICPERLQQNVSLLRADI